MAEYTKIETARTIICDFCNQLYSDEPCEPADCDWLRMLEEDAADVAPVVHGRWIHKGDSDMWVCSRCGRGVNADPEGIDLYCYHCGAKMDETVEDDKQ